MSFSLDKNRQKRLKKTSIWLKIYVILLEFHKDACVGMAANMIGVKKRVIIVNIGFVNLVMFNSCF